MLRRICNGFIMVAWTYLFLFCVTTDAYCCILMRFGFGILVQQNFYLSLLLHMPARGADDLKLTSEKPLLVLLMGDQSESCMHFIKISMFL